MRDTRQVLNAAARWAEIWLFDHALPLWREAGHDREAGGFHDRLDMNGRPVDLPKRVRVQARQIYVFGQAGEMGWTGDWRGAMRAGLAFLDAYRRTDGLYRATVARDGAVVDDAADLYDQAFVLFALAAAQRAFPDEPGHEDRATRLLSLLIEHYGRPTGGFVETDGRAGLRSNPHMHMLEALLAWTELSPGSLMERVAQGLVPLALDRMIDGRTGAVGEYFDDEWQPMPDESGQVREPGHQFEWAFLLSEAKRLLGFETQAASDRLYAFGHRWGVCHGRALFSVDADGRAIDASSRLWAQTERLRTAVARQCEQDAIDSFDCIRSFLNVDRPGLWHDRMTAAGEWVVEAAPASSLYHIMTGFATLIAGDALAPLAMPTQHVRMGKAL
ncbi:AGE family epimerase/isomerase [Sphingobium mellinum]|uniref:AGE family epimerase/isomerase n=1 Tax=Sphingobium mellinum TaxID=1387166 RepID=UPI0030ECADEC